MKKIVVVGATSNVGSYFSFWARDYFAGRYEIVATGRKDTDFFVKNGMSYERLDMTCRNDFDRLPQNDVHAVVVMAAAAPSYMVTYDPNSYLDVNVFRKNERCVRNNKILAHKAR